MRDNLRCNCPICKVERHLFISLSEPPGNAQFSTLASGSPPLSKFTSVSQLLDDLHARRNAESTGALVSELMSSLIRAGTLVPDFKLVQSVLVLAFTPTIHRTYREVRAWFRELEPEDIAQQTLAFFLQLTASAPADMLNNHVAFILSQALHRNAVRWARREQAKLLERERYFAEHAEFAEPAESAQFESVCLLKDFLDYSVRREIISEFERDLLLRMKVDGFIAKEVLDRHSVLSPKAVHVRVQRIIKRLQNAACAFPSQNQNSGKLVESVEPVQKRNSSKRVSTFSLSTFSGSAAISKSRRQLSPDIAPRQATTKAQQSPTSKLDSLIRFASLPPANERRCVIRGATSRRLAALQPSRSALTPHHCRRFGESLPSNPDAGQARITRKELAGNEENPPKQIFLPLAPARACHILILPRLCISSIRPGRRWLALGERRQRSDASVHDHNRSRTVARLHCGGRLDVRFW